MDIIFIRELRVPVTIGIYDWERAVKQTMRFDIDLGTDIAAAAASDNIEHTLDYKAVSKRISSFAGESRYLLVETLAERVAELVLREFAVPWLRLSLTKERAVRGSSGVGIVIERGAEKQP